MKRVISLALVAVILMMALVACGAKSDEDMIKDRINKYISCANNADMDGMLKCFNSATRSAMESMLNLLGDYAGVNLKDMMNLGALFGSSEYYSMSVDSIDNIQINGDNATADVTMSATVNGSTQTASDSLPLVKEDGDWYISLNLGGLF